MCSCALFRLPTYGLTSPAEITSLKSTGHAEATRNEKLPRRSLWHKGLRGAKHHESQRNSRRLSAVYLYGNIYLLWIFNMSGIKQCMTSGFQLSLLAERYWGLSQSRRKLRLRTASPPRHSGKADCCLGRSPLGRIMVFHSQMSSWKSPRIEGLNDFLPITLGMVGTRSSRPGSLRWDYPDYPSGRKLASSHGVNAPGWIWLEMIRTLDRANISFCLVFGEFCVSCCIDVTLSTPSAPLIFPTPSQIHDLLFKNHYCYVCMLHKNNLLSPLRVAHRCMCSLLGTG